MEKLKQKYDQMQQIYGDKNLNSVYGSGCVKNAKICLVFMNPTARNIATKKDWQGVRYQWLGTKQIWKFLTSAGLFDSEINKQIQNKKASEWDNNFCIKVYNEVEKQGIYITNLAKCTQVDARHLPDEVFEKYKQLLFEEIKIINPQKIVFFGNQVASIALGQNISVSTCRQKQFELEIQGKKFCAYVVFYPVGNGFFNADKAICDLEYISKI